jgi:hypothetical protein
VCARGSPMQASEASRDAGVERRATTVLFM